MINEKRNKMQGPGTEKQARISFILFLCILALLLATAFVGCSKETPNIVHKPVLSLSIDTRLPKDQNGYSVWTLIPPPPPIYIAGVWIYSTKNSHIKPIYKEGYWIIDEGRNYYAISIQINGFISPDSTYKIEMQHILKNVNTKIIKSNKWLVRLSYYQQSSNQAIFALYDMKGDTITISAQMGNIVKVEKIILK